ncbi:ABC transporter ATP-binding protein [Sinorhizobium sp. 7-81]|uniref:ABC transporter ATP-binding protein n=1 Tax=Sinorhizobium sp. 8-89 TaxID=3049089 RepID=UPI0024C358E7|nr:ABC transporter ATP-binding protein [Sinorhizobium sp. 8-89]MDK1494228.1 ABC transporter ATP-binding protein [Sinorhizobium sp. 8-89]
MLELENVTRRFGNLTAIESVSTKVSRGHIHGLIGPNGSGKSTMMNLISGFLKPTTGSINFEGTRISGLRPHVVSRAGVVRTFQLIKVYSEATVRENIRMAAIARLSPPWAPAGFLNNPGSKEIEGDVDRVLEIMKLGHVANQTAGILPSGMQRTLSVASAFVAKPKLLLLDEPLAGLNATEKAGLAASIREINKSGITILLVEHDMKTVLSLCSHMTVINFGKKIAEGPPSDIVTNSAVIEAYLGSRGGKDA